jgi:hypothetical protein
MCNWIRVFLRAVLFRSCSGIRVFRLYNSVSCGSGYAGVFGCHGRCFTGNLSDSNWLGGDVVGYFWLFSRPLYSFCDFGVRSYFNRTSLWMLLTAMGTVGYTLLDKIASEAVRQGPGTAARYGYIYFLMSFGAYAVLLRIFKVGGKIQIQLVGGFLFMLRV